MTAIEYTIFEQPQPAANRSPPLDYPIFENSTQLNKEILKTDLPKTAGITEQLEATNQMRWVGLKNAIKAQVEEIIYSELIYTD